MPGPVVGPCGHEHEPACPPTPAASINGTDYFTDEQIRQHGHLNYQKGRQELLAAIFAVIEDPAHGWSEGEMARAIVAAAKNSGD